jgi:hypothetical protein
MTKTYTINNSEYTVETVTAIAECDNGNEDRRQPALLVSNEYNGETHEEVVFGWSLDDLENDEDFQNLCENYSEDWESDEAVIASVRK